MADNGPVGIDPMREYAADIARFRNASDVELAAHIRADWQCQADLSNLQDEVKRLGELASMRVDAMLSEPPACSFCGKQQAEVRQLVAGTKNGAYICDECITLTAQHLGLG